jgi:hypothetical protein
MRRKRSQGADMKVVAETEYEPGGWEGGRVRRDFVPRSGQTRRLDWVGIPVLGCVDEEVVG